ncbi:hypothetical protein [Natrinema sp. 1APR25-10V2]|uniref:hypothetical protein n=1 Tax=Natrinema sp. 1APR25-10V2 TaxID=2951081 RepID=UPI002876B1FE|nr:hypothetical protein [Natrinema sp. 1APR25-10V2]MDS0476574.1 hypothetical protein [Natrinema sp. 1APR25-10V2]
MRRSTRYALALVVATAVTAVARTATSSAILLIGIWQVYAVGVAVVLRSDVRQFVHTSGSVPAAVFTGVTVFGVLSIAQGLSTEFHFGAAILAFGLAYFGFVCGTWLRLDLEEPVSDPRTT